MSKKPNKQNPEPMIDEDDLSEYIAAQLKLDMDTVEQILDAEMAFLKTKGLVVEGDAPLDTTAEVDTDELIQFVVSQTEVERAVVVKVLDAELAFLEMNGLVQ